MLSGHEIRDGQWRELYSIGPDGAVLVRPDGHVAWRAQQQSEHATEVLGEALKRAAGTA
jgi:putative polyketide hydroxylase